MTSQEPTAQGTGDRYILALDVGSSSTRALLFDATGLAVADCASHRPYTATTSEDGEVSADADQLVRLIEETVDEALQLAGPRAGRIAAVAVDTFWHGMLALDADGHPLTTAVSWADTRPGEAAARLRGRLDGRAIHQRTGAALSASYWPAKLTWLAEQQPDAFKRAAHFVSIGDYLYLRLFGRLVTGLSMASGTGLLVTRERTWDAALVQALGVRVDQLPALGDFRAPLTGLRGDYARRWPQLSATPWFLALGDGAAANVGSGCATPARLALTMGTSSAIRTVTPLAAEVGEVPQGLWRYLLDGARAVPGGALSEGGNLFAWMEQALRVPALGDAEAEIAKLPPDGHGLTLLPYVAGERSLGWHAEARATVAGIHSGTTALELLRAGTEALAYRLRAVYLRLMEALRPARPPTVIGSGAALLNSAVLRQVVADTLGVALYPSRDAEASARGAALMALEALGVVADVATVEPHLDSPVQPDAARHAIYLRGAARQDDLYQRLLGAPAV
jgi:gluconokinase